MSGIPTHQAFDLQRTRRLPGRQRGLSTPEAPPRPRPHRGPLSIGPLFPQPAGRAEAMNPCKRPSSMGEPAAL